MGEIDIYYYLFDVNEYRDEMEQPTISACKIPPKRLVDIELLKGEIDFMAMESDYEPMFISKEIEVLTV